jgi:DNA-binding response OmpR family regulator
MSRLRVLVVEGYEDAAFAHAGVLRAWGHRVCVANDGRVALVLAQDFQPDVVLLDIQLTESDGYQVARDLRARIAKTIDIVGLTALERDVRAAASAGIGYVLAKPLRIESLRDVLGLVARRNPVPSLKRRLWRDQRRARPQSSSL